MLFSELGLSGSCMLGFLLTPPKSSPDGAGSSAQKRSDPFTPLAFLDFTLEVVQWPQRAAALSLAAADISIFE